MELSKKTVVFSGRFDPVHPGHIVQVKRLLQKFTQVKVVILDYEERRFPLNYVENIFNEIFDDDFVQIISNKTHFGEITLEEFKMFNANSYAGGNLKVLRHMEKLGVKVVYCERALEYSARDYPNPE